jgi:hypothetical protein
LRGALDRAETKEKAMATESFKVFFVFVAVIVVTMALFSGWATAFVFRTAGRVIGSVFGPTRMTGQRVCSNAECRQTNPMYARYCRRCGRQLQRGLLEA